jgi:hypothetical protein
LADCAASLGLHEDVPALLPGGRAGALFGRALLMKLLVFMFPIGAIVGAIVGASRNRTREGAILGLLLGFVGVVVVVCMDPKPDAGSPLAPAGWRLIGAADGPATSDL